MTKGRRSSPIPQVSFVKKELHNHFSRFYLTPRPVQLVCQGPACTAHTLDVVQCRNVGNDDLGEVLHRVSSSSEMRLTTVVLNDTDLCFFHEMYVPS